MTTSRSTFHHQLDDIQSDLVRAAAKVTEAIAQGTQALLDLDLAAAALDDMDDRLDQIHKDYIQAILEHHPDSREVKMAVQLALVGRYYERIGDHAVNIGQRVEYMVTGWLPEHTGAARLAARQGHPVAEPGSG